MKLFIGIDSKSQSLDTTCLTSENDSRNLFIDNYQPFIRY